MIFFIFWIKIRFFPTLAIGLISPGGSGWMSSLNNLPYSLMHEKTQHLQVDELSARPLWHLCRRRWPRHQVRSPYSPSTCTPNSECTSVHWPSCWCRSSTNPQWRWCGSWWTDSFVKDPPPIRVGNASSKYHVLQMSVFAKDDNKKVT